MGDVADILGMTALASSTGGRKSGKSVKKPEGVSREVFSLLGQSQLTSIHPASSLSKTSASHLKSVALKKAVKWQWSEFSHSARLDNDKGFRLRHWQREVQFLPDYAFARFNKKCAVIRYTDEEYSLAIVEDDIWTKEETDILFDLCARYDLRWFVISDRMSGSDRSTSDLKARYYGVAKDILNWRKKNKKTKAIESPISYEEPVIPTVSVKAVTAAENAMIEYTFDYTHDQARLDQLNRLYSRTSAEEEEEGQLLNQVRRIDLQLRKVHSSSKEAGLLSRKSSKMGLQQFPPTLVEQIFNKDFLGSEPSLSDQLAAKDVATPSVMLRSAGFYISGSSLSISSILQEKITMMLTELGVLKLSATSKIPLPPVATPTVVDAYDKLRQDVIKLFALKSQIQKLANSKRRIASNSKTGKPVSKAIKKIVPVVAPTISLAVADVSQIPIPPAPVVTVKTEAVDNANVRTSGRKRQPTCVISESESAKSPSKSATKRKAPSTSASGPATKKKTR